MLMEETGTNPSTPSMLNTPKQMLMQETGILPHLARGGQPQMSAQDMMAELIVNNMAPEHFKSGGHSDLKRQISVALRRKPFQSLFNALGFTDVASEGFDAIKHGIEKKPAQATESAFNAISAIPAAMPGVPAAVSMAVPYAGQFLSQGSANAMARNPAYREQMQSVSQSPLGGALGGDAALAAQIMGNRDYYDVLQSRQAPEQTLEEEAPKRGPSPLYQKTMVK